MPFVFKHTLIMEGNGHGFSETYYFTNGTADLGAAFTKVANTKYKRAKLLGSDHYIKGERIALVLTDTGTKVTRRTRVGKFYLPGTASQPSCESNISLQVLFMNAGQDQKKLTFLGGVWNGLFADGDAYAPVGSWTTFFNQWVAQMLLVDYGWMGTVRSAPAEIDGYIFDPVTGRTTYTLKAPGITWASTIKPTKVSVDFPGQKSPLDGVQNVFGIDTTHAVTVNPAPAFPFVNKGQMSVLTSGLVQLSTGSVGGTTGSIEAQDPVSRKRGRPLLVSRGRAAVTPRM